MPICFAQSILAASNLSPMPGAKESPPETPRPARIGPAPRCAEDLSAAAEAAPRRHASSAHAAPRKVFLAEEHAGDGSGNQVGHGARKHRPHSEPRQVIAPLR